MKIKVRREAVRCTNCEKLMNFIIYQIFHMVRD